MTIKMNAKHIIKIIYNVHKNKQSIIIDVLIVGIHLYIDSPSRYINNFYKEYSFVPF